MAAKGKRPMKGSLGTSFIIEKIPGIKRISCSNCINYEEDRSCSAKGVSIMEIGYDFWNQCDKFDLSSKYDSEENQALVARTRSRIHKKYTIDKKEKKKGTIKSKNLTVKKVKKETTNSKQVILRCEIQKMNEQGMSFEKIADRFGVDKDVIRKIHSGAFGSAYKPRKMISRDTVQSLNKQGMSYQKIADKFGVDKDLIRKIDLGFFGTGYRG